MSINRLAIIPARGGSIRIKDKNIKKFFKKPIISYPINALKKSKLFKKIHISTDSLKIKKMVDKIGVKTDFMRPRKLALDHVIINDVLRFVVKEYEKKNVFFDEVWLVYSCTPFLTSNQLIKASIEFGKTDMSYPLMSFREYDAPIEWAFKKEKSFFIPLSKKKLLVDSKKIKKKYYESATFVIFKKGQIFKNKVFSKYYGHILGRDSAIDIDYIDDWKKAELLFKVKKINKKKQLS